MVGLDAVNIADVLEGWSLPNTDITFLALVSQHFGFNGVFTEALAQFGSFAPASANKNFVRAWRMSVAALRLTEEI